MIEVNALIAVFVVEGLVALSLLVVIVAFFISRRKGKERSAVKILADRIENGENARKRDLSARLSESCDIEESAIEDVLAEINENEKKLYQQIVKIFLGRDATLLSKIDKSVQVLTEPFCTLVNELSTIEKVDPAMSAAIETAHAEIQQLRGERERLSEQLSTAIQTMEEVSNEYSSIFDSSKHAEELDFSRKRMLNTYKHAEKKMKEAFMEQTIEELKSEEF